jgi:hypothetical protein
VAPQTDQVWGANPLEAAPAPRPGVFGKVVSAGASLMGFSFASLGLLVVILATPLLAFTPVLAGLKRQGPSA